MSEPAVNSSPARLFPAWTSTAANSTCPFALTSQASTDELALLRTELYGRAERAVVRYEATGPHWLVAELGTPPHDPGARARWRSAAQTLERHRLRWSITDPRQAFGNEIVSPTQSDEQRRPAIGAARDELSRHGGVQPRAGCDRELPRRPGGGARS